MVKQIWQHGADNTHPCSHGEMVRWWYGLVHIYAETNMVKWCTEYTPMFTWWNRYMVKWCGVENTKVKWCNGETIILIFDSHLFLVPLQIWGPILLLHFIGCCIIRQWKSCLWMMPQWLSKRPISLCNTLWCRIPLLLSDQFLLFIILFIPPATANTVGGFILYQIPVSRNCLLWIY